jgi:Fe-S oxidoreductase
MLDDHRKELDTCSACPSLFQSACPVFQTEGNRSVSPWGIMQALNRVQKKDLPFTAEIAELSYHCLTCRACTDQCEHGVEVPAVLSEARIEAVKQDVAPKSITGFLEKFHRHNNPFSKDLLYRLKEILPAKYFERRTQVVYYATCTTISKTPEIIRDTFELFEKLKIDFVGIYADPIQCCGYPLISAGAEYDFIDLAEINYHSFKKHKLIITGSPACAHTLRKTYAKYDLGLENRIVTINQFLKPYLKNINYKLKKNVRTKLMYHDPCYLSRYLGEVELPREMIAQISGYQPGEFLDNREHTGCSGQGGCYSIMDKEASEDITRHRLAEAAERKINTIVTQCPSCVHKMRKAGNKLVVKDLISYLNDSIEGVVE